MHIYILLFYHKKNYLLAEYYNIILNQIIECVLFSNYLNFETIILMSTNKMIKVRIVFTVKLLRPDL